MRFLHTMLRVSDPEATIRFFRLLGLEERRRMENEAGRYTLIFLGVPGAPAAKSSLPTIGTKRATPGAAISGISPTKWTIFMRPAHS